jgi:hypothetical protein
MFPSRERTAERCSWKTMAALCSPPSPPSTMRSAAGPLKCSPEGLENVLADMYWIELGYRCVRLRAADVSAPAVVIRGLESSHTPHQLKMPTDNQFSSRGCDMSSLPAIAALSGWADWYASTMHTAAFHPHPLIISFHHHRFMSS